jgi:hypothetical protein
MGTCWSWIAVLIQRQGIWWWWPMGELHYQSRFAATIEGSAIPAQRGLTPETASSWGLGLKGSRLMLPLADGLGRCCGISGRTLTNEDPKHRNSAKNALFCKSELLFTLDRAAPATG